MTNANWITITLALVGLIANLGWFLFSRFVKTQEEMRDALTGKDGAVARIHQRIDGLGEKYQTKEATEMQFEHLRAFMERERSDSERRHAENISRLDELRRLQKEETDSVKLDVRSLRAHLDEMARDRET